MSRAPSILLATGISLPPVVTYITSTSNAGATSTFTGVSIGTAAADRYVVAIFGTYNNGSDFTATSATIGGNAATEIVKSATGSISDGVPVAGMYGLLVPTGTTANFAITWGGTATLGVVLHIFTITGLLSSTAVATAQAHSNGTASASLSANVNTSAGGVVIGGYFNANSTLSAWTGLSTGAGVGGSDTAQTVKGYCASASNVVAATPRTVSAAPVGSGRSCILSASFR